MMLFHNTPLPSQQRQRTCHRKTPMMITATTATLRTYSYDDSCLSNSSCSCSSSSGDCSGKNSLGSSASVHSFSMTIPPRSSPLRSRSVHHMQQQQRRKTVRRRNSMQPEEIHAAANAAIPTTATSGTTTTTSANGSPLSFSSPDSQNNNNSSNNPNPSFRKMLASSLSFRRNRQRQQQRHNKILNCKAFVCLVRSARSRKLLANVLFMLFVLSFSGAYLLSQPTTQRTQRSTNYNKNQSGGWISNNHWTRMMSSSSSLWPFWKIIFGGQTRQRRENMSSWPASSSTRRRNRRVRAPTNNDHGILEKKQPPSSPSVQLLPSSSSSSSNRDMQQLVWKEDSSHPKLLRKRHPQIIYADTTTAATTTTTASSLWNAQTPAERSHEKAVVGNYLRGGKFRSRAAGLHPPSTFQIDSPNAPASCHATLSSYVDFTLVSQLSWNRLWMMEHHCQRWKHAISIAIYVGSDDTISIITKDSIIQELVSMGCRDDIRVTLVSGYSEQEYPVNVLRNRALDTVTTSHVVYLDVDFWPSVDLYDVLQQHAEILQTDPQQALVIPAFQLNRQCREWKDCRENNIPLMAQQKNELLDLVVAHKGSPFDPTNVGGHGSTRYQDWLTQKTDELVEIPCVLSNRYEPYLVFRYCRELPPFQEAFTGYGKNKMTWMMQLRRNGYRFSQIGTAFCIHYPHLDSKARMHWNGGEGGVQIPKPKTATGIDLHQFKRGQIDETFVQFRTWLEHHVPDRTVVGKCNTPDALDDDERLWVDHHQYHSPHHHHHHHHASSTKR